MVFCCGREQPLLALLVCCSMIPLLLPFLCFVMPLLMLTHIVRRCFSVEGEMDIYGGVEVRACVRACVRPCVRAAVRAALRACWVASSRPSTPPTLLVTSRSTGAAPLASGWSNGVAPSSA